MKSYKNNLSKFQHSFLGTPNLKDSRFTRPGKNFTHHIAMDRKRKKIKRSRSGCHNCKRMKVKCDELRPKCSNCLKAEVPCDYSIKLIWGGRPYKDTDKRAKLGSTGAGSDTLESVMSRSPSQIAILFVVEDPNSVDKKSKAVPSMQQVEMARSRLEVTHPSSSKTDLDMSMKHSLSEQNAYPFEKPIQAFEDTFFSTFTNGESNNGNKATADKISITDHYPDITDGIESLSKALENIASGGNTFNLQNSEIFNSFLISNIEDKLKEDSPYLLVSDTSEFPSHFSPGRDSNSESTNISRLPSGVTEGSTPVVIEDNYTNKSKPRGTEEKPSIIQPFKVDGHTSTKENYFSPLNPSLPTSPAVKIEHWSPTFESLELRSSLKQLSLETASGPKSSPALPSNFATLHQLPEKMLEDPYFRALFNYWIDVAADNLVPAPSTIYVENPFKAILPRMALKAPSILYTLLAFAASVRAQFTLIEQPRAIIDQLLAKACSELLKLLQDKASAKSDETLATVLLLSCLENFTFGNFDMHRSHTLGARQIILSRGMKLPTDTLLTVEEVSEDENIETPIASARATTPSYKFADLESDIKDAMNISNLFEADQSSAYSSQISTSPGSAVTPGSPSCNLKKDGEQDTKHKNKLEAAAEGDINYFLMRWFAYLDVIGALSATKKSDQYLTNAESKNIYVNKKHLQTTGGIDRFLGFDVAYIPYFANIAILIRQTSTYLKDMDDTKNIHLPSSIITQALELKENYTKVYNIGEEKRTAKLEKIIKRKNDKNRPQKESTQSVAQVLERDRIMRSVNKMFFNMGLLNLYRRVLMLERLSYLVQDLCKEIGDTLQLNIEPKSPAEICSIFCTFCASCETIDPKMQALFLARFTLLIDMGLVNASKAVKVMEMCWRTGKSWKRCAADLDIDLTLM